MKKIIITALSVFACFGTMLISSCKYEPCEKVVCAYSGVCEEGLCKCQIGYEGIHCETVMRDKFIGSWQVNEDGTLSGAAQYTTSIEAGNNINEVKIFNIQNVTTWKSTPLKGYVKGDTITLDETPAADGSKVTGWGFIKGTNPLDQHYYQHAVVTFYYAITNSLGQVNKYGIGEGIPSNWSK
jgi:hypothetical protein